MRGNARKSVEMGEQDRANWSFGKLLSWHLDQGTRPEGTPEAPGTHWSNQAFALATGNHERSVRNWRNDRNPPSDSGTIERVLFGENEAYAAWRRELREARTRTWGGRNDTADRRAPASLPRPARAVLGRDALVARLVGLIQDGASPVLVQGAGGIGKTTLTLAALNDAGCVDTLGERRWFAALATAGDVEAFEAAVTTAVGLDPAQTRFQALLDWLGRAPGVLVLDNLETAWDRTPAEIEQRLLALSAVPGLRVVASIRGARQPALGWHDIVPVEPLTAPDDAALFRSIAQQVPADDPDLRPLLDALGGIPLAIELVGLRTAGVANLHEIRTRWDAVGVELAKRPGIEADALTSLETSIALSLESPLLQEPAKRLFALLGCSPAGLDDDDRETLLGNDAFDAAGQLRTVGLAFDGPHSLDLLPPIRDFATRQYPPEDEDRDRWRTHFLRLAAVDAGKLGTTEGGGVASRLVPALANLETAIADALEVSELEAAVPAARGLGRLIRFTGAGGPSIIRAAANAARKVGDALGEANCIQSLGDIALARSDHDAARKAYEEALPLYRKIGAVLGEANCIKSLGDIALERSDHDAARKAYEEALPLYRKVGDVLGEANCIRRLGDIALRRSDHDAAREAYEKALPLYRKVGAVLGEANCIKSLGDIALRRSDHDAAREAYEAALPLYRKVGDVLGEANCIRRLGDIALERSDHNAARKAYEEALPLYRKVGDALGEANCIQSLGDIALERSDHDAAREAYEQALPLYRKVGAVLGEANCIQGLGDIALRRSDHDAAREAYEKALPLYRKIGAVRGEANCILRLGEIALARSDHGAAREAYEEALPLYRKVGDVLGEANCIQRLGDIARAEGDSDTAKGQWESALALYERIPEPYSIGWAHRRLARIAEGDARAAHVARAREMWTRIDRPDLVATLDEEFDA